MAILGRLTFAALLSLAGAAHAQDRQPIIDMHLHAREADYAGPNPPPMCAPFTVIKGRFQI